MHELLHLLKERSAEIHLLSITPCLPAVAPPALLAVHCDWALRGVNGHSGFPAELARVTIERSLVSKRQPSPRAFRGAKAGQRDTEKFSETDLVIRDLKLLSGELTNTG